MVVEESEEMVSVHMDSILDVIEGDFIGHKNEKRINKYIKGDGNCENSKHGKTNKTYKDIVRHSLIGDPVLLKDLQKKIDVLNKVTGINTNDYEQKIQKSRRVRCFAEQGDELDIEKVYNGDLDSCWTSSYRKEFDASHKFVTLFIENGENWNVDVHKSFWRSAIAVYLTRELQRAGKSVRIVVGNCGRGSMERNHKLLTSSMTVKEYNQQMNLERVAAMTHLGFFRCVGFALMNVAPYKLSAGYGSHVGIGSKTWPIQLQKQVDKGHTKLIHVKPVNDENGAIRALKFAYEQLGIK